MASSLKCTSNLRQLVLASTVYAGEWRGFWPPAHVDFFTRNNDRWHGVRASNSAAFDFELSPMRRQ